MNIKSLKDLSLGIDVGSTTAKAVLIDKVGRIVFSEYTRHRADIRAAVDGILARIQIEFGRIPVSVAITGSAGMALAEGLRVPFEQEVMALRQAILSRKPEVDVAIELGGEDAKIVYFTGGCEQRMNGSCAGGTGAFIDQMAVLLGTDAAGLNELARGAKTIHPIASRCGVFAKSDVQPLLNEGARREDVAASVLQAVVNQTVSGLACGRPVEGTVALLGGPLHYLSELRAAFARTLNLDDEHLVVPAQGQLVVAFGAALSAARSRCTLSIEALRSKIASSSFANVAAHRLAPLFDSEDEVAAFRARHDADRIPEGSLVDARGPLYLGVDAGSTTFKLTLIDEESRIVYQRYCGNGGDVVRCAQEELAALWRALPCDERGNPLVQIARATTTGYGEALLKEAFSFDAGEVETMAHLRAASALDPEVDFVLDIGGQDMKCLRVKDGVIDDIVLNEACSSGCGSFLETFAQSMGLSAAEFADAALDAQRPVDLGSRCTVFMNSCVKQAQKEGATLADIAAGLAYSVVKNALFKVIKAREAHALGAHPVVQGGTFCSDAVLRAFELVSGREAKRPVQAGLMGAYGAALLSRDAVCARDGASRDVRSSLLGLEQIEDLSLSQRSVRCRGCENACRLTVNDFGRGADGKPRRHISGNRCERGAGRLAPERAVAEKDIPDLVDYKCRRLFDYEPHSAEEATRPTVGIPRALNLYENYPFWFTFFNELGFRVELSSSTTQAQYERGMASIPSESVCYPAKVAHGHVAELAERGVDFVFMPCIRNERQEDPGAQNSFNCPIVSSYPETLRLNAEAMGAGSTPIVDPYLPYADDVRLAVRLHEELAALFAAHPSFRGTAPTKAEVRRAVKAARAEDDRFHADVRAMGDAALEWMERTGNRGIVLIGRPYHLDPAVNHGIPQLIRDLGFAVLTEDAVAHRAHPEYPLRTVNQWVYHARLYAAAKFATTRADLDVVQLNSFGCGLDAVTVDQVAEILAPAGKVHTVLKIDEVSNLGAARIRLRSLAAALDRRGMPEPAPTSTAYEKVPYTRAMSKAGYTIVAPQMAPTHFDLLAAVFRSEGHRLEVLPSDDAAAVDAGLRYVNNDIGYPSILTTGQVMAAVESGRYDLNRLAVLIVQTGGGCRATNYIGLIRRALAESGNGHIPVISLSFSPVGEHNSGWRLSPSFLVKGYFALALGDVLDQCLYRTRPYERDAGSAEELHRRWLSSCSAEIARMNPEDFTRTCRWIISDFDALPLKDVPRRPCIGVVGEILVKYHPTANNHVVDVIEAEGCEAVVPGLVDFFRYVGLNMEFRRRYLDGSALSAAGGHTLLRAIEHFGRGLTEALAASERFDAPGDMEALARKVEPIVQLCNNMGEGWLMTAEMVELIENGASGIVLCSPFGCLPNHVIGKGVVPELTRRYPQANISAVDYDPGASAVNQVNRIKLMCAMAKESAERDEAQSVVSLADAILADAAAALSRP